MQSRVRAKTDPAYMTMLLEREGTGWLVYGGGPVNVGWKYLADIERFLWSAVLNPFTAHGRFSMVLP